MELDDSVFITLTKSGADILNKENEEKRKKIKVKFPQSPDLVDTLYPTNYKEGQVLTEKLWVIFSWFGLHSYIEYPIPFTNLRQVTN